MIYSRFQYPKQLSRGRNCHFVLPTSYKGFYQPGQKQTTLSLCCLMRFDPLAATCTFPTKFQKGFICCTEYQIFRAEVALVVALCLLYLIYCSDMHLVVDPSNTSSSCLGQWTTSIQYLRACSCITLADNLYNEDPDQWPGGRFENGSPCCVEVGTEL